MLTVTLTARMAFVKLGQTPLAISRMVQEVIEPKEIEPEAAWSMLQQDTAVLLVDVRSDMEYLMIGHPVGALNVAWIDHPSWTVNDNFVADVRKLMLGRVNKKVHGGLSLILICRSGNRSVAAAKALMAEGIEQVHVVRGGFEGPLDDDRHRNTCAGWRHAGLPWEQC